MKYLGSLYQVIFEDRSAKRFYAAVIIGLGFSVSVILSTFGIMAGFEKSIRTSLKGMTGDITLSSSRGFFELNDDLIQEIESLGIRHFAPLLQTEGFITGEKSGKGVLIRGFSRSSFRGVTGVNFKLNEDQIIIGKALAEFLKVGKGDFITLTMASGHQQFKSLPSSQEFEIADIRDYGLYQKNLRVIYIDLATLQDMMQAKAKINSVVLNVPKDFLPAKEESERVTEFRFKIDEGLSEFFILKPYWRDFDFIFQAVKEQRFIITMALQMIVIISIFNLLAMFFYIGEKKGKELFFLKAIGLGQTKLTRFWSFVSFKIWAWSSLVAVLFTYFFKYILENTNFIEVPGQVYHLSRFTMEISWKEAAIVFSLSLFWVILLTGFTIKRYKKSLLKGLRLEFS